MTPAEYRVLPDSCDIYFFKNLDAKEASVRMVTQADGTLKKEKGLVGGGKPGSIYDTHLTEASVEKVGKFTQEVIHQVAQNDLGRKSISAVYSSPMKRSKHSIEPLAKQLGLPCQEDGRIDELNHGQAMRNAGPDWKKTPYWETYSKLSRLQKLTTAQGPGADTNCQVIDRMKAFAFDVAEKNLGKAVVCCAHDGAMRALLNLQNIEQVYGQIIGKQPSENAVHALQGKDGIKLPEALHFTEGKMLHIRVYPSAGKIEIIKSEANKEGTVKSGK